MIHLIIRIEDTTRRVRDAADRGAFRSFSRAAFAIMRAAKESITTSAGPSTPGEPPHTHRGQYIRRAIRYAANRQGAVIGTAYSAIATAGEPHEHGGRFRGTDYPARPFMQPALVENLPRFAGEWKGQIGG